MLKLVEFCYFVSLLLNRISADYEYFLNICLRKFRCLNALVVEAIIECVWVAQFLNAVVIEINDPMIVLI